MTYIRMLSLMTMGALIPCLTGCLPGREAAEELGATGPSRMTPLSSFQSEGEPAVGVEAIRQAQQHAPDEAAAAPSSAAPAALPPFDPEPLGRMAPGEVAEKGPPSEPPATLAGAPASGTSLPDEFPPGERRNIQVERLVGLRDLRQAVERAPAGKRAAVASEIDAQLAALEEWAATERVRPEERTAAAARLAARARSPEARP